MRYSKLDLEMKKRSEQQAATINRSSFARFPRRMLVKDLPKMAADKRGNK